MLKKLGLLLGLVVILVIGYAIYTQTTKSSCRSLRLACHKEVIVFERIYAQEQLHALIEAIRIEGVSLEIETQKAYYAPSKLFDLLDLFDVRSVLEKEFGKASSSQAPRLNVLIYENDSLDPGKKSKEAKLYAGYLVFSFYKGADLVYKVQIDFMDKAGKDIAKRIACAKASLLNP